MEILFSFRVGQTKVTANPCIDLPASNSHDSLPYHRRVPGMHTIALNSPRAVSSAFDSARGLKWPFDQLRRLRPLGMYMIRDALLNEATITKLTFN